MDDISNLANRKGLSFDFNITAKVTARVHIIVFNILVSLTNIVCSLSHIRNRPAENNRAVLFFNLCRVLVQEVFADFHIEILVDLRFINTCDMFFNSDERLVFFYCVFRNILAIERGMLSHLIAIKVHRISCEFLVVIPANKFIGDTIDTLFLRISGTVIFCRNFQLRTC